MNFASSRDQCLFPAKLTQEAEKTPHFASAAFLTQTGSMDGNVGRSTTSSEHPEDRFSLNFVQIFMILRQ